MELLEVVSAGSLAVVGTLALIGVFHPHYEDTLAERVGLSIVSLWCLLRVPNVGSVHLTTVLGDVVLHIGLACYAVGVCARKVRTIRAAHRAESVGVKLL
jgi:hypothetical protein